MSNRHDLELHRESLADIRNIMNSMKTLAYMENRKLARLLASQQALSRNIEEAAADLLAHFPDLLPADHRAKSVLVVVGTERGFCGNFNQKLARHIDSMMEADAPAPLLVIIGHKLLTPMGDDPGVEVSLAGATVSEDIPELLNRLVEHLTALQAKHGALNLSCLYHTEPDKIDLRQLLPSFRELAPSAPDNTGEPLIHMEPEALLKELSEQYLLSELHEIFSTSLNAENLNRVTHLDGAVRKLDEKASELTRRANALRREEIIEEIEVILLNASAVKGDTGDDHPFAKKAPS